MKYASKRLFPHVSWAWPSGPRHLLITAAICPDADRALTSILNWLDTTDLNDAGFPEHRLLSAITTRFDKALKGRREYPRLQGLHRLNWTRSRMAVATATPALAEMAAKGIKLVLLKGASRVAMNPDDQKSRTSYDLDLLVSNADFLPAFEVLAANDWKSIRGETILALRARLSSVRARNFKKGHFGDIDLHRSAYHFGSEDAGLDAALIKEAIAADYYGVAAYVPSAPERLCIAIAHGGRENHSHSDWLVDMARIITSETVDWDKVVDIVKRRNLRGTAAVALSYLSQNQGLNVPADILLEIMPFPSLMGLRHPIAILAASEAKGAKSLAGLASTLNNELWRLRRSGRKYANEAPSYLSFAMPKRCKAVQEMRLVQPLTAAPESADGNYTIELELIVRNIGNRTRIEFELNSKERNIAHFRTLNIWKNHASLRIRLHGLIRLKNADIALSLSSLDGKLIDETADEMTKVKYAAVPFAVQSCLISPHE